MKILRNVRIAAIVLLAVLSCPGCQSMLHVRVDKIEGVQSRMPDHSAEALILIHDALAGLDEICTECRITYGDAAVEGALAALADAQRKGHAMLPIVRDLIARQSRGEIAGKPLAAQVAALHRRARGIMPCIDLEMLRGVIEFELDDAEREAMRRLADDLPIAMDSFTAKLAGVRIGSPGFGGFRQGGVFQINSGDPAYDRVLNAGTAAQPVTEAVIRAVGDTAVMLVQESPAQMRLYQVSNDPSSIMRNASFIMNKVLQATVKFGAVE